MDYSQRLSQLDSLPVLKHVSVGQTIGQGTFAVVKVASIRNNPLKLVAIKYIHRAISHSKGIDDNRIGLELSIHKECSGHPNMIKLHMFGTDNTWIYMVMELAESGDLFDKIEPDIGIDEELANFYFTQLINAVDFMHQKGVAHRDIKPENILLDKDGNLKLADFGLATIFKRKGSQKRLSYEKCGSPPYMAPEIIGDDGYDATMSDIWACGIVLFVLLSGQIPWQEPNYKHDEEYTKYVDFDGRILDTPWNQFSQTVRPLLRSIIKPDVGRRFTMDQIRLHPWVNQENSFMDSNKLCNDSEGLAERLLSNLQVGLSDEDIKTTLSETSQEQERNLLNNKKFISNSQPTNDIAVMIDDEFDIPVIPATQDPVTHKDSPFINDITDAHEEMLAIVSKDPTILQFKNTPQYRMSQLSTTQKNLLAFKNMPFKTAERMTRFFSILPIESLIPIIRDSLHRIGVSTTSIDNYSMEELTEQNHIYINVNIIAEKSKMPLRGYIKILKCDIRLPLRKVEFIKSKGDPLEWRQFFKKVTILSRDAVYID